MGVRWSQSNYEHSSGDIYVDSSKQRYEEEDEVANEARVPTRAYKALRSKESMAFGEPQQKRNQLEEGDSGLQAQRDAARATLFERGERKANERAQALEREKFSLAPIVSGARSFKPSKPAQSGSSKRKGSSSRDSRSNPTSLTSLIKKCIIHDGLPEFQTKEKVKQRGKRFERMDVIGEENT